MGKPRRNLEVGVFSTLIICHFAQWVKQWRTCFCHLAGLFFSFYWYGSYLWSHCTFPCVSSLLDPMWQGWNGQKPNKQLMVEVEMGENRLLVKKKNEQDLICKSDDEKYFEKYVHKFQRDQINLCRLIPTSIILFIFLWAADLVPVEMSRSIYVRLSLSEILHIWNENWYQFGPVLR
jgi:hypothetical protein